MRGADAKVKLVQQLLYTTHSIYARRTWLAACSVRWLQKGLVQADSAQVSSNEHGPRVAGLRLQQLLHQLLLLGTGVWQVDFEEAGSTGVARTKPAIAHACRLLAAGTISKSLMTCYLFTLQSTTSSRYDGGLRAGTQAGHWPIRPGLRLTHIGCCLCKMLVAAAPQPLTHL
jgi:hypothetical protein